MWDNKLAKWIRVLTIPPIPAFWLLLILHIREPAVRFFWPFLCLCVLPLLSYPISLLPCLHRGEREAQRSLAVLFSVLGYLGCLLFCIFGHANRTEWILSLTYLISGVLIALFSFCFHVKSSGHAAGVAGPVFMLILYVGAWTYLGLLLLPAVLWASLTLKRHTPVQLLWGAAFPVVTLLLLQFVL